jgi:AGCS family alanine or glycine:cation symporter
MSLYQRYNDILNAVNGVIWANWVLYTVLAVGLLFTIWTGFCQYRALVHGTAVTRGKYDRKDDPGAINHFQALSAALSATVGLGNIAGVAVAIALGGPGAIFWMWMVGIAGMALKTTEVSLSMIYRNTDDPDNPHGGPMWVASKGFAQWGWGGFGKLVGGIFCVTLLISTITGGNMFQAWNVGQATKEASGGSIPPIAAGIILAVLAAAVILGGIKRIGAVAGRLVPFMVAIYLLAAFVVLFKYIGEIPDMLRLIVVSALPEWLGGETAHPEKAFLGGTFAYALFWGMKRALFSSEAGQGSSPIAHSAAKTDEPVREGIVAGLEPFIDTIVVCTLTSLVILSTGAWNRDPETLMDRAVTLMEVLPAEGAAPTDKQEWTLKKVELTPKTKEAEKRSGGWNTGDNVFMIVEVVETNKDTGHNLARIEGVVVSGDDMNSDALFVEWKSIKTANPPRFPSGENEGAVYKDYPGAALTQYAFNIAVPGLGTWLVLIASWLFALSTIISWNYYGEQGVVYLFGEKLIVPYRLLYCALIIVATGPFIQTDADLDNLTALGTGVMLWANIPIMLIFSGVAMGAYHSYGRKLKAGEFHPHKAPKITDVIEGHDAE